MNKLFEILDGIISSDYTEENFSAPANVQDYAEHGCGYLISLEEAQKIIEVGREWLDAIENGNGEWSRMRYEAQEKLENLS